MDTKTLTWLHLSDIHFGYAPGGRHRIDQQLVCDQILIDAGRMLEKLGPPDLVLVTGDVAFKADPEHEYPSAVEWLNQLIAAVKVKKERLYLVPGNHDVDRGKVGSDYVLKSLHESLRNKPADLSEALTQPNVRAQIWLKMEAYAGFARRYAAEKLTPEQPFWVCTKDTSLGRVVIAGLNTTLLSFNNNDSPNNLALGLGQLRNAIKIQPQDALLLVLQHHPPSWLFDGSILQADLESRPHILFCGHLHEQGGMVTSPFDNQRGLLTFVAGAGHNDPNLPAGHAYSWGQLSSQSLHYYPRTWNAKRQTFVADKNSYPEMSKEGASVCSRNRLPQSLQNWLYNKPKNTVSMPAPPARSKPSPDFIDLPYPTLDPNCIRRERLIKILKDWFADGEVKIVVFNARSGFGKSTLISQLIETVDKVRKLVLQVRQLDPQAILRDLGKHLGLLREDSSLPTNIAELLFYALQKRKTLLILDSFQYLLSRSGEIIDGNVQQLLSLVIHNALKRRVMLIISSNRPIENLSSSSKYCKILGDNDLVFETEEGIDLLNKYGIIGAPDALTDFLGSYQHHPYTLNIVARQNKCKNIIDIDHQANTESLKQRFRELAGYARNLIYFLALFPRVVEKNLVLNMISRIGHPLYISPDNFMSAVDILKNSGLLSVVEEKKDSGREALSIHILTREYCRREFMSGEKETYAKCHAELSKYYVAKYEESNDVNDIDPLYDAVWHGCQAEQYNESLDLFWNKICRGREFYSQSKGYYVRDLVCITSFFSHQENKLLVDRLEDDAKEWLPSIYSYLLKNLGKVGKAINIREIQIEHADQYRRATDKSKLVEPTFLFRSVDVSKLMQAFLLNGQLDNAKQYYDKAIDFAELGKNQKKTNRFTTGVSYEYAMKAVNGKMGIVSYIRGEFDESMRYFKLADENYGSPISGADEMWFCDLLALKSQIDNVPALMEKAEGRGEIGLDLAEKEQNAEKIGYLYYLKARILEAKTQGEAFDDIRRYFDSAYENSKSVNRTDMMSLILVAKLHYLTRPKILRNYVNNTLRSGILSDIEIAERCINSYELGLFTVDLKVVKLKLQAAAMSEDDIKNKAAAIRKEIQNKKYHLAEIRLNEFHKEVKKR